MKKVLIFVSMLLLNFCSYTYAFAGSSEQPGITVNGQQIDTPAIIIDGNLLLPLRKIGEGTGFKVQWSNYEQKITLNKPGLVISFNIGSNKLVANDHEVLMRDLPVIIGGRTFVTEDFLTGCLGLQANLDPNDTVTVQSVVNNPIRITTEKISYQTNNLTVNIQYPQLQDLSDPAIQNNLNSRFKSKALQAEAAAKQSAAALTKEELNRNVQVESYFDYSIKYNQKGILSIVFADYRFNGGAHGTTVQSSDTFDLNTGTELTVKDLFTDKADYVSLISSEIKAQMAERNITPYLLVPFNAIKTDQDFFLANNSIVIYFQQYEYAPYSFGILEFPISFHSLGGNLKPDLINPS